MSLRVLNDTHLGVNRTAGTTGPSKLALKWAMLQQFKELLPNSDLMILGDLFDTYEVSTADLLNVHDVLRTWLAKGYALYLVPGNHDLSKTSTTISSFELLASILAQSYPINVVIVDEPAMTSYGYVIPHLPNQELFNAAIASVPECDVLYLHCNYNNFFATQSDHSLNLSKEQADECKAKLIVIAHEHNAKVEGKIVIPGNQIASSISDWVHSNAKFYVEIVEGKHTLTQFCSQASEYIEVDWKFLESSTHAFIRVTGTAKSTEAAQVVNAIAKFRAKSPALVITNAVRIESDEALGGFSEALESVQGFDVWQALEATMTAPDMTTLRGLK